MNSYFDIVIIGNGASSVASMAAICKATPDEISLSICILGKVSLLGRGDSYNEKYPCLIMNTPAKNLSIVLEKESHFLNWSNNKKYNHRHDSYIKRMVYADYLEDTANSFIKNKNNVTVSVVNAVAMDMNFNHKINKYEVITDTTDNLICKKIIIATGNAKPTNQYLKLSSKNYVSNLYPVNAMTEHIDINADIGIIGSSLSAVDMAICLQYRGHKGKIYMVSRKGILPNIKGTINPYVPIYCCKATFEAEYQNNNYKPISSRSFIRIIRHEFSINDLDWRDLFRFNDTQFTDKLKYCDDNKWNDVLMGIQHEVDRSWRYLCPKSLDSFIGSSISSLMHNITPIPLVNAKIINKMINEDQLVIKSGLESISAINSNENYEILFAGKKIVVDYIINATGPSIESLVKGNYFLKKLIKKKMVVEHKNGGIKVCPFTGRVNSAYDGIYSIGQPTCNVNPLINNLQLIVLNSCDLAQDIVASYLKEDA